MPVPTLVCLLPVRNGAADLPGYFASVAPVVDAVVALDDGSTDDTRALLAAQPLVAALLTNPPRPDYRGWDDGANRARLLAAAADLAPGWILSLDADERLDPSDGAALRSFVATEAQPAYAYGFELYRMGPDLTTAARTGRWVYRLFAAAPGQRFPTRQLHFAPVPTSIPRAHWVATTLRIQHLGSLDPARGRARLEKYRQADPAHLSHYDSRDFLPVSPADLVPWQARPVGLPVVLSLPPAAAEG